MITGIIIPPQAPIIGNRAFSFDDNSPTLISLLISKPTDKKKIAIRKSLIIWPKEMGCPLWLKKLKWPIDRLTGCCQNEKYHSLIPGRLAMTSADMVKNINITLEFVYCLKLLRKL